jgi:polysaccharide biosynthesis protein VpsQ
MGRNDSMRIMALSVAVFIIVITVLANGGHLPGFLKMVYAFPCGDKVGHLMLYGTLSFFVVGALRACGWRGLTVGVGLIVIAGLEELSQGLSPNREFSALDFLASSVGIGLGAWLMGRWLGRGRCLSTET